MEDILASIRRIIADDQIAGDSRSGYGGPEAGSATGDGRAQLGPAGHDE